MFKSLKCSNGRYLEIFLSDARCQENENSDMRRCENVNRYLSSYKIVYKNIELLNDQSEFPDPIEYREISLDFLLEEFNGYFPDGDLEIFDIFDPQNMPNPNDYASACTYGITKIKEINNFFKIGCENLLIDQWQTLLNSIITSSNYCQIKNSRTTSIAFWSQLLKWSDIIWGTEIKRLLHTVLVIPISRAEAERGFSSLKYIRDAHRSRLSPASLDAIMRIKMNGPDELELFQAAKYARNWIKKHIATDSKVGAKSKDTISHNLLETEDVEAKKKYLLKSSIF